MPAYFTLYSKYITKDLITGPLGNNYFPSKLVLNLYSVKTGFKTSKYEWFIFLENQLMFKSKLRLNVFLLIAVHPRVSLHPGPYHVIEWSNVTLPTCHVTGYPAPVVTWRKSSGQLPQGRVQYNSTALQISNARKVDSDTYLCSAVNLLGKVERKTLLVVVSLPVFTVKPPGKVSVGTGDTLTLNCRILQRYR